jgi:nucleoid DNA-binding protein
MKAKLKTLNLTNLSAVQSNKISVQIGANQQEGAVMTQLLISFLGKARKEEGQYRQANYQFENNQIETARFFSQALTKVITPKRLVMLGTSGSMWDVLCENLGHDEQQFELIEAVENNAVTQPMLDNFSDLFSEKLNVECVLKLIPYGDDVTQQVAILQKMAEDVKEGDSVALDLTGKFKQKDAKSRDVLKAEIFKTALILMYRNCGYKPSNLIKTSIYGLFCKNSYRNISEFCCGFSCRINDDFQLIVWQVLLPKIHLQKQLEFGKYLSAFKPY